MTGFVVFVVLVSYVLGVSLGYGTSWMMAAVLFSVLSSFASYYWGDKMVLAMSGARPADRKRDFDFFTVAENLAIAAGLPKPKLYVIDDTAMNAFATGRDPAHAVVGTVAFLADMFLRNLWWGRGRDRDEDRGLGQIMLVVGIVLAIVTPIIATLIQLAVSRRREFLADASAADLTRYPEGLARALEKLSKDKEVLEAATNATAHLYITNPFKGKQFAAWFSGLFNTHPPIEERIKILRAL
ncbi:MAG: Protease HtpX-like protein [Microgenomates group bacterium GW2011_GWA2_47_8]|nr:MAG: Protease HtpX-like protein [Microgenomates group bacterium GW2011_GWA2_47_8]